MNSVLIGVKQTREFNAPIEWAYLVREILCKIRPAEVIEKAGET